MAAKWIEALTGSLEDKKQYRLAKARLDSLPEPYREVGRAIHRYLMYTGDLTEGDTLVVMFQDLVDLMERASLDGTPIREIVGDDPVDFTETFAESYLGKRWIDKERQRLIAAVDGAKRGERE